MIEIDVTKEFNESKGFTFGDQVLQFAIKHLNYIPAIQLYHTKNGLESVGLRFNDETDVMLYRMLKNE